MAHMTAVSWGRALTAEEYETSRVKMLGYLKASQAGYESLGNGSILSPTLRFWFDEAAANEYIAFVNTFTPPPTYAEVITIS